MIFKRKIQKDGQMLRKIAISLTASMLLVNSASANVDQFLNDSVVEMSGATTVQTAQGTMLYGGGLQMRARNYNFQPVSLTGPSVKAGCGGIDLTFGSFSFLDVDKIVQLLQAMMAQAPGVMFDLALKTLCPACADTIKALNQLANQINQMNMNSCSANKALAGFMQNNINESLGSGTSGPDWLKGMGDQLNQGSAALASFTKNYLSSAGCAAGDRACIADFFMNDSVSGSLLDYIMTTNNGSSYWSNADDIAFLRAFTGDIRKIPMSDGANGAKQGRISVSMPISLPGRADNGKKIGHTSVSEFNGDSSPYLNVDQNTKKLLMKMIGDPSVSGETVYVKDSSGNLVAFTGTSNMYNSISTRLDAVASAIAGRTAYSADNLKFLGNYQIPLYQILNKFTTLPSGDLLLQQVKPQLIQLLAYEMSYEYFAMTRTVLLKFRDKFDRDAIDKLPYSCGAGEGMCSVEVDTGLQGMIDGTQNMMTVAYEMAAQASSDFNSKLASSGDAIGKLNTLQQYTLARSNPRLFAQYNFSKSMTISNQK